MKAFLLAAGFGERLRPLTENTPKPLLKINDIPSICYSLMLLKEAGIKDVVCNLHYKHEKIIDFFEKNSFFDMNIEFSIEEEILGTGGGLKKCENFFDEDFVLINSDIISDLKLGQVIESYRRESCEGMMVLMNSKISNSKSTVSVENKKIIDINNMYGSGIAAEFDYMGIAVLSKKIFKFLSPEFSSIVKLGYSEFIKKSEMNCYEYGGMWIDIGTMESYKNSHARVKENVFFMKRVKTNFGENIIV